MLRSNREGPIGITDEQKKPGIGWKLDKMRKRAPIELDKMRKRAPIECI
jgi:hypothetical protein